MSHEPMKPFNDENLLNKIDQSLETGLKDLKDRVSDVASKAKNKAGQVASAVSEKLGEQRENAADALGRAASTIHEKADSVPGGTKSANVTHSIAKGMDSTASYLRDRDFAQMGKDVMNVCRRYPTQSVIAALAVGFLLGRSARSK